MMLKTSTILLCILAGTGFMFVGGSTGDDDTSAVASPGYARQLVRNNAMMDEPEQPPVAAGDEEAALIWNPASASISSGCVGSLCLISWCVGSGCANSKCVGSGCLVSICLGSGCGGSVCVGSGCFGSACAGSGCFGCNADPVAIQQVNTALTAEAAQPWWESFKDSAESEHPIGG